MIDHESHLKQVVENQRQLSNEINELTNILTAKREQFSKLQGIYEYLTANGIKLQENEKVELPESEKE